MTLTIVSFSSVRLSAVIRVRATRGGVSDVLSIIAKRTFLRKRINEIVRILLKYYYV